MVGRGIGFGNWLLVARSITNSIDDTSSGANKNDLDHRKKNFQVWLA
jgi:hypothetical protein